MRRRAGDPHAAAADAGAGYAGATWNAAATETAQLAAPGSTHLRDAQAQWEGTSSGQGAAFWRAELQARQQQQQIVLRDILARLEQERAGRSCEQGGGTGLMGAVGRRRRC